MFGNKNAGLMDSLFHFRKNQRGTKKARAAPEVVVPTAQIEAALAKRETYFASLGSFRGIR